MFGPSGCGKTFFALDLAVHVARGQAWRGRAVLQGAAVYIAAEGGYGIQERLTAFSCKYEINPEDVPLYVISEPIDLCNSDTDVNLLLDHLRNLPSDPPVRLLLIDTTSRALAGGNENSPDHMGALVIRCDKLRSMTGAHNMLLHHTGKNVNQGARGHSLLRAAVDTEIEMRWDKDTQSGSANVTKQRDTRTEGSFGFRLDEIDVETSDGGKITSSCVVTPTDGPVGAVATKATHMPKSAQTTLRALEKAISECGIIPLDSDHIPVGVSVVTLDQWRDYAYREGISTGKDRAKQQAFKRASEQLIRSGYVGRSGDQVWLTKE